MPNIGVWEIVIVVVIALLVFGPKKLPELGSSLGRSITGFKKGLRETTDELKAAAKEDPATEAMADADTKAKPATVAPAASPVPSTASAAAEATPAVQASTTTTAAASSQADTQQ